MRKSTTDRLINTTKTPRKYRVAFEEVVGDLLHGHSVPDLDEPPFDSETEAWTYARELAAATRQKFVNFYVIDADTYTPVEGYQRQYIENR
jgi:hypothetical protein